MRTHNGQQMADAVARNWINFICEYNGRGGRRGWLVAAPPRAGYRLWGASECLCSRSQPARFYPDFNCYVYVWGLPGYRVIFGGDALENPGVWNGKSENAHCWKSNSICVFVEIFLNRSIWSFAPNYDVPDIPFSLHLLGISITVEDAVFEIKFGENSKALPCLLAEI